MKSIVLILMLPLLFACSSGFKVESYFDQDQLTESQQLIFEQKYKALQQHVNVLASVGAQACLPGQLMRLQSQLRSIGLMKNAQLWAEALYSTAELSENIQQLECQLQSVQRVTSCSMNRSVSMALTDWYKQSEKLNCQALPTIQPGTPVVILSDHISLFDTASDQLNPVAKKSLSHWWSTINSSFTGKVHIIGHADSRGSSDYNLELSSRRASQIANFLIQLGLDSDRIILDARGEQEPRIEEHGAFEQQLNRRVSVTVMSTMEDE